MIIRLTTVILALAVLVPPVGAVEASVEEPGISLARERVRAGDDVPVSGRGLSAGALVSVVLCGNSARRGSLDCALSSTVEVGVRSDGTFATTMRSASPPMPCPCVVLASGATPEQLTARIRLRGHPLDRDHGARQALPAAQARVEVVDARLEPGPSLSAWFGAADERTLTLRLRNEGTLAGVPRLELGWGDLGARPTNFVETPDLPMLAPRSTTTVEVPVRFDALANGELVVAGSVRSGGDDVGFADSVTVRPWGLFGLGVLIVLIAGLAALARTARRRGAPDEADGRLSVAELFSLA